MELAYETRERAPTAILLETTPDRLTLTFPLTSAWPEFFGIAFAFVIAAIQIGGLAYVSWRDRAFVANNPIFYRALLVTLSMTAFYVFVGAFSLRSFRRAGHLPRRLVADAAARTLTHRRERSPAWRQWPMPDPTNISVRAYRQILPSGILTLVLIRPKGKRVPIFVRFRPDQIRAADQFVTELRRLAAHNNSRKSD